MNERIEINPLIQRTFRSAAAKPPLLER